MKKSYKKITESQLLERAIKIAESKGYTITESKDMYVIMNGIFRNHFAYSNASQEEMDGWKSGFAAGWEECESQTLNEGFRDEMFFMKQFLTQGLKNIFSRGKNLHKLSVYYQENKEIKVIHTDVKTNDDLDTTCKKIKAQIMKKFPTAKILQVAVYGKDVPKFSLFR